MEALFRSLPALLEALPDNETVRDAVVFAAWRKIAGEQLGEHTAPVGLNEGRLSIAVSDNSWKKNLASLSGQMIFKINAILGSAVVIYIEFVIDSEAVQKATAGKNLPEDVDFEKIIVSEITAELKQSARIIADEKLRNEFLQAAASCLARKRKMR